MKLTTTVSERQPLLITKELLRPWSPCAEGYRWFLDKKFPDDQASYQVVMQALRTDGRHDDARWLTDKVWGLVLNTPATVADVTADHKAEALELIESTQALKVEAPAEGAAESEAVENDGIEKVASSGHYAQIGSSGDSARIGSSGYYAQIGSSGDSARIGSSGHYAQIGSSGHYAQIGSSGDSAQIGSSGDYARIGSSGHYAQINATGQKAVICSAGLRTRARAGAVGVLALAWHDAAADRVRIAVGYVGEGLKADTWYEVVAGEFVEVAP